MAMTDPPLRFGRPEAGLVYRERPAAYGLLERDGRLALVYVTLDDRPPFYDLPGGGIDPGEDEEAALRREFGEETGLVVRAGRRVAAAEQYMISAHREPFLSQGAFFEAAFERVAPALKIEDDHELVWMAPTDALTALRHDSHAWAVAAWLRLRAA
ncbi:MAG TPA: NUDIX domain-containing protein [Caulobacteraceae bacterium]|nr:NUDIX domain-containing protein [Caulobacteraceae bacterium]